MKTVTVNVDLVFDVPDDTDVNDLTVEFPGGNPVAHSTLGGPIPDAVFGGHTTQNALVGDDDDLDFDDDDDFYDDDDFDDYDDE